MGKMRRWKKCPAFLLAIGLITAGTAPAGVPVYAETEAPFFKEGAITGSTVTGMEDAAEVVAMMTDEIGMNEQTQFEPWRSLKDEKGNNYYVFRQMYGDVTVSGGAVKVVTDENGTVLGVVSSVETDLPDGHAEAGITAGEAEAAVAFYLKMTGHLKAEVLPGYTEKVILPVALELDMESEEEKEELRFVWVVYTNNDSGNMTDGSELPYLAHYVTMSGEYLYSLPTVIPNDEAGSTGFSASYFFESMEPVDFTGTVTLSDGTPKEISISLMRDTNSGMYYLGNLERRIVVADCYEFLYNNGNVVPESKMLNFGWDNSCLLALYNYCRAWDYYNEIGWRGGDGYETPMIILKDYCDSMHNPIDNAAYAGSYYGWQVFLSSSINDYSQCLDVLGHEFTHCVTSSVMTYNAYSNDYGAINEAISDIQGNLCEMMAGATTDTTWELGENSSTPVRSMSDPHSYSQPEYKWDLYYIPNVKCPTLMNDRGGVHSNSSLLNRVAYILCEEGGMTCEEARKFWFAVDCSMVPGTDYAQLSELMPWVLRNVGMERYASALDLAITETEIGSDEIPSVFESDRALVRLKLPDTEEFSDGNWMLYILSVDVDEIQNRTWKIINEEGEYAGAKDELFDALKNAVWKALVDGSGSDAFSAAVLDWLTKYYSGLFYFAGSPAGTDGTTVQMVCRSGYTVPFLMYMRFESSQNEPVAIGMAAYMKGQWRDLVDFALEAQMNSGNTDDQMDWLFGENSDFFFEIPGGQVCEIPSTGLQNVHPVEEDYSDYF